MSPIHVLATSHGTDNPQGQEQINDLRDQIETLAARQLPGELIWHEAYVDVQQPRLPQVLSSLPAGERAIVLPLLVADGVHTTHDIAQAVAARPLTAAASPLGALPALADVLVDRARPYLKENPKVVLAAAGTRLSIGQEQIQELAGLLRGKIDRDIPVAFCAGAKPLVPELLATLPEERVLVLSSLLADGYFQTKLANTNAWVTTSPLLPDVTIAKCFLIRLSEGLKAAGFTSSYDEVKPS